MKNKRSWKKVGTPTRKTLPKKKVIAHVQMGDIPAEFYYDLNGRKYEAGAVADVYEGEKINLELKAKDPKFAKAIVYAQTTNDSKNIVWFIDQVTYNKLKQEK